MKPRKFTTENTEKRFKPKFRDFVSKADSVKTFLAKCTFVKVVIPACPESAVL